jgi:hypothetical protein
LTPGASYVPAVLTGGAGYGDAGSQAVPSYVGASSIRSQATEYVFDFPLDQWAEQYGNWSIVPKVSTYFNNAFLQAADSFNDGLQGAVDVDAAPFTKEGTIGEGDFVRTDETGSAYEIFFNEVDGSYTSYLRYEESDGVKRAMRLMFDIGGMGNNEMLELYETADYKFVKVHWWSNVSAESDAPPKLTHFVSVVDKNSEGEKSTGRWINENLAADDFETHTFSFGPGTAADSDYHTYETGDTSVAPAGDRAYGYFNKTDYYVTPTTDAPASSGEFSEYVHPDKLASIFDQGLTPEMWDDLRTTLTGGTEGIGFVNWDLSDFE